jgi:hypothetical protein
MNKGFVVGTRQEARQAERGARADMQAFDLAPGQYKARIVAPDGDNSTYRVVTLDELGNECATYELIAPFPESDFATDDEVILVMSPGAKVPFIMSGSGGAGCCNGMFKDNLP